MVRWGFFFVVLLALALMVSVVPALAQEAKVPQSEIPSGGGYALRDDGQPVTVTLGWNIVHATGCYGAVDGNGVPITALFGREGNTTWLTVAPNAAMIMAAACQTGNHVGFHVITSAGLWNAILSAPTR